MVSWVGLRGAVPIILATFPLLAGISKADTIFNMVFFIVLTSALLQGASIPIVARWLRVDTPLSIKPKYPMEFEPTYGFHGETLELEIPKDSAVAGKEIVELGLPNSTLILLIHRNDEFIVPKGSTVLEAGDRMIVLTAKEELDKVRSILESKQLPTHSKA